MGNLNSTLTCNMTYSPVSRIRMWTYLRDHYSAPLIYLCIMTIFITLYKYDLACNLAPDFFICFISYHNPYVSHYSWSLSFSQMHHAYSRISVHAISLAFVTLPLWISTDSFLQTTLILQLSASITLLQRLDPVTPYMEMESPITPLVLLHIICFNSD